MTVGRNVLDFPVLEGEEHHFLYLVKSLPDVANANS